MLNSGSISHQKSLSVEENLGLSATPPKMVKLPVSIGDMNPEINFDKGEESEVDEEMEDSEDPKNSSKEIRWRKEDDK